jgi:hypothetical protein
MLQQGQQQGQVLQWRRHRNYCWLHDCLCCAGVVFFAGTLVSQLPMLTPESAATLAGIGATAGVVTQVWLLVPLLLYRHICREPDAALHSTIIR